MRYLLLSVLSLVLVFLSTSKAMATDAFEIQVYEPECNEPGQFGLELHVNTVVQGRQDPEWEGEVPPHHLTHLTFEPSYGVTKWWELGAYLQFAYDPKATLDGQYHFGGYKLRSKFIGAKIEKEGFGYGLNLEVSHVPDKFEEHEWATEFRPIFAYQTGPWLFDINPILDWDLSGDNLTFAPELEPAIKIRYNTEDHWGVGVEYYSGLGPANNIPSYGEEEHYAFAAFDLVDLPTEFNFGIGRGLTSASNDWVVKAIVGATF